MKCVGVTGQGWRTDQWQILWGLVAVSSDFGLNSGWNNKPVQSFKQGFNKITLTSNLELDFRGIKEEAESPRRTLHHKMMVAEPWEEWSCRKMRWDKFSQSLTRRFPSDPHTTLESRGGHFQLTTRGGSKRHSLYPGYSESRQKSLGSTSAYLQPTCLILGFPLRIFLW